jgi:hypothetical protein
MAEMGSAWSVLPLVVEGGVRNSRGGSRSDRRRSCSNRLPTGVMVRPRQPAEARSSTAHTRLMALVSPGNQPMTLVRRLVSSKNRSMKFECRTRPMAFDWKPQIGRQSCFVGEQDPHSRRVEVGVFGGERLDPLVDDLDQLGSRFDVEVGGIENRLVSVADLGLHPGGNLGEHVPRSMNKTSLAQRFWVDLFDGRDQALGAVRDDQQRSGKAAFAQIGQEVGPRVGGLAGPR